FNNQVIKSLNFSEQTFKLSDGKLPYPDKSFDFINSSQVLEHVEDIDFYYREAARVLKDDGICFFSFPHRLQIYDSHSRTYIIHWFPKLLRKILYDIFSQQRGESLNNYLFLNTVAYHKKISNKYFSISSNISSRRLKNLDKRNYKGNLLLRNFADKLMNVRFFGKIFIYFFSFISSADIILKK
ncbi:methyltransferase domain-containing protein, partial [Candidatus Pelagibacter sp.]|nr:methyltransferase domain-containing protein [Candidatus Pelagibacter sp.]